MGRHKSVDSSDSSDSDSSQEKKSKDKKDKKKDKKEKNQKHKSSYGDHGIYGSTSTYAPLAAHTFPPQSHGFTQQPHTSFMPEPGYSDEHDQQSFRGPSDLSSPPPDYAGGPPPPPSGFRVPLSTEAPFPHSDQAGPPAFYDADGVSPIFIGSALMESSVHPCKIGPHLQPFASVPYGGGEHGHRGRFDLLPFRHDQMEWVPTSYGRIPPGRRPVEGGYEDHGAQLYHAAAFVNGVKVPGKTGEHLGGCRVAFGGGEHSLDDNYDILCWRSMKQS